MVFFSLLNGALMPRFGYVTPWYIVRSSLTIVGSAFMYTVNTHTPTSQIYGYTILVGAGSDCYVIAGFAIMQSHVPVPDIPNTVCAMIIYQDLKMTVFLAVSSTRYQNVALRKIAPVQSNASPAQIADLITGVNSHTYKGLSEKDKGLVIPQITEAMSSLCLLFLVGRALSLVMAVFLGRTRLLIPGSK
ncbi:hypothetical protein BDW67DRAFT_170600 [Aspergillus spinulosporus]